MTRQRRNEGEDGRRLREKKEIRYREDSGSDSEEERRRNNRKRRPTRNMDASPALTEKLSNATSSNSINFRAPSEDRFTRTELQPYAAEQESMYRAEEVVRAEEQIENENIAGPSTRVTALDSRRERNRLAQQRSRQKKKNQEREEEMNRIREQNRQALARYRQRLTQEQIDENRERDREAHSQQRQRLTEEQLDQNRERDREAHSQQRLSQTPQRRQSINASRRIRVSIRRGQLRLAREHEEEPQEHHCGPLSVECSYCFAYYFQGEQHRSPDGTFNPCCRNGILSLFPMYPAELRDLFTTNSPASRRFFKDVRKYNTALSFASMECKMAPLNNTGPYTFKLHGEILHWTSPAMPQDGRPPSYGQLFFVDESVAVDARLSHEANQKCDPMIMQELTRIINTNHQFAQQFQMLRETYRDEENQARLDNRPMHDVRLVFHSTNTPDPRRYNAPRVPEVAVVYVGPDGEVPNPMDYVIKARGGAFHRIPVVSRILDPSIYPLFFLRAEFGWHPNIQLNEPGNKKVSQKDFYCWYLSIRDTFNPIHYGRALFQQFLVGSWINTEQCRLNFIRNNQTILRSEFYNNVREIIQDGQSGAVGCKKTVLPATFTSSPRYMLAQYQDAMSITARFGKPDLFLTFTCNPNWAEITENLKEGQSSSDRPDLVARVFRMKLDELLKDVWERRIFGEISAYIFTVEWQKRGLPHAHMLFTLSSADKPRTPEDVDSMISSEIPPLASRVRELVGNHMIHRDCGPGSPCWVDMKCSKKFPKAFQEVTDMDQDGYPAYRRRDDGVIVTVGRPPQDYGNKWVVPHSPYLLLKYNAHINLEICSVIHATKYLYKYVYKGSDKARLELRQRREANGEIDEISEHLDARYVCPPEAFHRLFAFQLHGRSNPVIELAVHEEGRHITYFEEGEERRALERNQTTTLLGFFEMNRLARELKAANRVHELGPVDPNQILCNQFPEHFTYNRREGKWKVKQHANRNIGRMHSVYPSQEERYCIRQLLLHKTGDCSFAELFTVNGVQHRTAKEAAITLGLIRNPDHFNRSMEDANLFRMPYALRSVFACLLSFDGTFSAEVMFETWKVPMSEDYLHSQDYTEQECYALTYFDIVEMCTSLTVRESFQRVVQPPLPARPQLRQNIIPVNHMEIGEDGPGGSGKTFTYECIYHLLKAQGKSVVCTAWTGIAANLLPEGRTVASYFKLDIDNDCQSTHLKPNSQEGREMAQVDVFVIDECSMISNKVIASIDSALRDMTGVEELPFGGKTVLIGGDFRQVLPIPNSLLGQTAFQCCLKNSTELYPLFRKYTLTENMRAATASAEFKNFLLSIGEDRAAKDDEDRVQIPQDMLCNGDLIDEIFDGVFDNADELSKRAILSPKNVNVEEINQQILNRMQGETKVFYSVDTIDKATEDTLQLSQEFLHSLKPANLSPHKLELKIGCIVMLIRNLNVSKGLCNGTRLQVEKFGRMNAIQCRFINGVRKGESVIIPRIDLRSSKGRGMSFVLTRRQYNAPRVPEVAVVYVGPDGEVPNPMDYVIKARGGAFHRIPVVSRILDPSIYPLFFLRAEFGWHPNIQLNEPGNKKVSQKDFYCWYLSIRDTFNPIHYGRALFQQFLVGSWINTEQCRLNFIRNNQTILRSEFYNNVREIIQDGQSGAVGCKKTVLPATFTSSPRYMLAQYQDAMSITARFGKPDLFLTFTCNPNWAEITENLKEGQSSSDRPDLVARVFRMKLDELLKDVWERRIFGEISAYIFTVEWQKRGLPHAHMLFTLSSADKPRTPEDVDSMISSEIPPLASRVRELVGNHMIHRDCGPGSPCWVDMKCSKKFPKAFQEVTDMDQDGYPAYRRRDDGVIVTVGRPPQDYGNKWVVPHSPYLLLKYNAHINLEICSVIHATKYLYKYVYKGSDKARLELRQRREANGEIDEISEHLDARYVCPPEAFHRLFAFQLHGRSNPVIELAVHEEGRHIIYFEEGEERRALERNQTTTLLGFFEMNRLARELKAANRVHELGPVDPNQILCNQFPEHFTYNRREGKWKVKQHANRNIGRMHSVYPSQEERYCIRQLLLHKTGDCSFAELFTVNGVQHRTAKEAAITLGLIRNPDHFNRSMEDANLFRMPYALRSVFACLLSFDGTFSAEVMFETWKVPMSEDYLHSQDYTEQECYALTYFDIVEMCTSLTVRESFQRVVQPPLPARPQLRQNIIPVNHMEIGEDGPGGSGKTFTYECIYHLLKAQGKSVVCTAWTGIAANLLPEGRTVASYFKLDIDNDCQSTHLKPNSQEGREMAQVDVFVIDECSMISNKVIASIDSALRDMTGVEELPFGGKTVLIGGDFRQVLPIPNSLLGQTAFQCCLKNSTELYPLFRKYTLTENMRAATASAEFKNFLLSIGEDRAAKDDEDRVQIPQDMLCNGDLIDEIFDGVFDNADELSKRAILSPKNVNVEEINQQILNRMQGETKVFYSVDTIDKATEDTLQLSQEFLHSLKPANLSPHKLELKIGCIVMLIRNLNVSKGLCNGTRLQVEKFGRMNAIQCRFINGVRKGESVIIPRIDLRSSKGRGMSFVLTRRQFPFKLAFAMTINKSQGQSLDKVGIYLPTEVFTHGQLYVALSRATTAKELEYTYRTIVTEH